MSDKGTKVSGHRGKSTASNRLVFISHDTRDANVALAFANLVKIASSDEIEVFRSSDTSGVEGIPYGEMWFNAILSKLKNSSDVICLITPRSLDRPWILWEAGVATGMGVPVHGVPIGLPPKEARKGPFALFQGCSGDGSSLAGLLRTILSRIGRAPNNYLIGKAVEDFLSNEFYFINESEILITDKYLRPDDEVVAALHKMRRNLFAVDGIVEVCKSLGYSGWCRSDMDPPEIVAARALPPEFEDYKGGDAHCPGGSQSRYSLRSISEPFYDQGTAGRIRTVLAHSKYRDVYKLSRLLDKAFIERGEQKLSGRFLYGHSWFPLEKSPLVHNVNVQPVVITRDEKIILMKRSAEVHHYPGCWSASIEEQMVGPDDRVSRCDQTYFDCAERGVQEELACTPIPETTRVLSVGIEHGNLSASFICVLRVEESFREACKNWLRKALDPYEAASMDCIPLEKELIADITKRRKYRPSDRVFKRTDDTAAEWHPTARMRLYALSCYIEGLKPYSA